MLASPLSYIMSETLVRPSSRLWRVEGPWLRDGSGEKLTLRGVTYGPFKPNLNGEPWPDEDRLLADVAHIASLGFNSVRIYEPPSTLLLEACEKQGLSLMVGIAWTQHVDFVSNKDVQDDALDRAARTARAYRDHSCVTAILVGNEIEKTLVRWMGPEQVRAFLEKLITVTKEEAPEKLVAYANYPSTEYLLPRNADFLAFNVFLEQQDTFASYLQHLQNLTEGKPLIITEFGLDSRHHGEAAQAEALTWQRETAEKAGVAGSFWFSYTDEWHRAQEEVTGWEFGIVTRDRTEKAICEKLRSMPVPTAESTATISVIVCTRNGASTLRACLEALDRQTYRNYEVLVIDDGSTDQTAAIAKSFTRVKYHLQAHAGLSVARNYGMEQAVGSILAYTDDDCIPDEDWLLHISRAYDDEKWVAAGGPNLPPPARTLTEACVARAPGAPAHVLLNDEEAEHLPGCNLTIRKSALQAIGGFYPEYKTAGDDVDVCWRLQKAGGALRFVPAAQVFHHRRATLKGYLRQQKGYGRAEAMLMRTYPQRFSWLGGARWGGAIYGDGETVTVGDGGEIHYGRFGAGLFQSVASAPDPSIWVWCTGLLWLEAMLVMAALMQPWSLGLAGLMALAMINAARLRADRSLWQRADVRSAALLWLMCLLQPVYRDWGRITGRGMRPWRSSGGIAWPRCFSLGWWQRAASLRWCWWTAAYTHGDETSRDELLPALINSANDHGLGGRPSACTSRMDVELDGGLGMNLGLMSVTEYHSHGVRLTRVALWERPSRSIVALVMLLVFTPLVERWSLLPLIFCWIPLLILVGLRWRTSMIARGLVMEAAAGVGMKRHHPVSEPSSAVGADITLAQVRGAEEIR